MNAALDACGKALPTNEYCRMKSRVIVFLVR